MEGDTHDEIPKGERKSTSVGVGDTLKEKIETMYGDSLLGDDHSFIVMNPDGDNNNNINNNKINEKGTQTDEKELNGTEGDYEGTCGDGHEGRNDGLEHEESTEVSNEGKDHDDGNEDEKEIVGQVGGKDGGDVARGGEKIESLYIIELWTNDPSQFHGDLVWKVDGYGNESVYRHVLSMSAGEDVALKEMESYYGQLREALPVQDWTYVKSRERWGKEGHFISTLKFIKKGRFYSGGDKTVRVTCSLINGPTLKTMFSGNAENGGSVTLLFCEPKGPSNIMPMIKAKQQGKNMEQKIKSLQYELREVRRRYHQNAQKLKQQEVLTDDLYQNIEQHCREKEQSLSQCKKKEREIQSLKNSRSTYEQEIVSLKNNLDVERTEKMQLALQIDMKKHDKDNEDLLSKSKVDSKQIKAWLTEISDEITALWKVLKQSGKLSDQPDESDFFLTEKECLIQRSLPFSLPQYRQQAKFVRELLQGAIKYTRYYVSDLPNRIIKDHFDMVGMESEKMALVQEMKKLLPSVRWNSPSVLNSFVKSLSGETKALIRAGWEDSNRHFQTLIFHILRCIGTMEGMETSTDRGKVTWPEENDRFNSDFCKEEHWCQGQGSQIKIVLFPYYHDGRSGEHRLAKVITNQINPILLQLN